MRLLIRIFGKMLNRPPIIGHVSSRVPEPQIPKLIHQTYPKKVLPIELQANVDALKTLNPGWTHHLYDDDEIAEFICKYYGLTVLKLYERIDPAYGAARADLFRYLLLYQLGGVYLDIKSAATRPLDTVLLPVDRFIVSQWPSGPNAKFKGAGWHDETRHVQDGEFQQWFIISASGHPFMKAVIENVLRNLNYYNPALHGVGKNGVLRVTGPIAYTLAIAPLLDQYPYRRADAESDLGIEYSIYPTVDKGDHRHLKLFKTHYSQSKTSIVRLTGMKKALSRPLMATANAAKALRSIFLSGR